MCSSSQERASDSFDDLSSSERRTCYQLLWVTGGLNSFVERWSINLGGGRLLEIRTAAVGQAYVPEHVRRPLLFPRCGVRTNGACPASANLLICGANRTIITGCTYKPRAPPSSYNIILVGRPPPNLIHHLSAHIVFRPMICLDTYGRLRKLGSSESISRNCVEYIDGRR